MKTCMVILLIILSYMCLVAHVLFSVLVLRLISYVLPQHVFFVVMVKVKKAIIVMILLLKNYVSRHVFFLEHIPSFSISNTSQQVSKSYLICIDPFLYDPPSTSSIDVFPSHETRATIDDVSPPPAASLFLLWLVILSHPAIYNVFVNLFSYLISFIIIFYLPLLHFWCPFTIFLSLLFYRKVVLDPNGSRLWLMNLMF